MNNFYVYEWIRPDTREVFYVGKGAGARDMSMRGRNKHFIAIVNKLKRDGLTPTVERIAVDLSEQEAFNLERAEIVRIGRRDINTGTLVNMTDGGEGASGAIHSDATKAKISAAHRSSPLAIKAHAKVIESNKGRVHSAETRANMSVAFTGRIVAPETRAKISASLKGRIFSDDHRLRLSAANRARTISPETRAKMYASRKGGPLTTEHKARISAALSGRTWPKRLTPVSVETRARLSAAGMGRVFTPEVRAKIGAGLHKTGPTRGLYKGVYASGAKWKASHSVDGKRTHLGTFLTSDEAAHAYDAAAIAAFGIGNCYLNFPAEVTPAAANDNTLIKARAA